MTATTFAPTTVLLDTRPARGKHRARRSPADVADVVLRWSQRQRGAFHLTGAVGGALIAATMLP